MRNRPLGSLCLAFFLFLCLVVQTGGARFVHELAPSPLEQSQAAGKSVRLTGQVYRKKSKENYQIFYLKETSILYQNHSFTEPGILVYDDSDLSAAIGSVLAVTGKVTLFEEERNPGSFNQKLYWQKQDIHGFIWASSVEIVTEGSDGFREWLYNFRIRWRKMLFSILGERDGSTLAAMLLGEKGGMDPEIKDLYQANGIGHVLAISGLHLSFIGLGIYRLLRRLTGSYPAAGLAGILFLSTYILMIGLTVSALRAMIMFLFRVGADITGRHYDGPTALGVAAVAVLLWRPLYLYDGGFWMSFGAILAVQLILPLGGGSHKKDPPFLQAAGRFFCQSLWTSAGITCMLLPVLLYFFYEIPVYCVFLNLIVIPLMSGVLFLGLTGSLLCLWIYPLGAWVLRFCGVIFRLYETLCQSALKLPCARLVIGQPKLWQVFAYYVCLTAALLLLWRLKTKQEENRVNSRDRQQIRMLRRDARRVRTGAGMFLAAGLLLLCTRFGAGSTLQITMLDVGQGDGIFIESPAGGTYFVDGGSSDVKQVGKYRIEPFLKSKGVRKLDYIFISHGDSDHICGVRELMERQETGVKVDCLVLPPKDTWDENLTSLAQTAADFGVTVATMEAGQVFSEGGLTFTCLWPSPDSAGGDVNELSMVLALSWSDFDMLFTGDLGQEEEPQVIKNLAEFCPGRNVEVLKTGHHGSRNSTSEAFLEAVRPSDALISAGRDNHYGHPHAETLDRLKEAGSRVYCTKDGGALTVEVKDEGTKYRVEEYCR